VLGHRRRGRQMHLPLQPAQLDRLVPEGRAVLDDGIEVPIRTPDRAEPDLHVRKLSENRRGSIVPSVPSPAGSPMQPTNTGELDARQKLRTESRKCESAKTRKRESIVQHDTLYDQRWRVEVQKESHLQASCLEI